ncbi:MAG: phosphodiester glycosidase family protein, partial [Acidimicrobiales bacterium]
PPPRPRPDADDGVLPRRYLERGPSPDGTGRRGRSSRRGRSDRRSSRRPWRRVLVALATVVFVFLSWAFIGAATSPGNVPFSAKLADWFRSHHAAFVSNTFEHLYYDLTQPPKGGRPKHLNALPSAGGAVSSPGTTHASRVPAVPHLPAPPPVPLVVQPALPGEGVWKPVGPTIDGYPGMYEAQFRADNVYTGQITTAVWIDPLLMKLSLVPGQIEPGGTWPHPPYVTHAELPTIAAAFNGGFRLQDAHGGFYLDGRTAVPLVPGAASFVIYRNGHINIGAWGTEVHMTPDVVSVLQNLVPMVDNGKVSATATYNDVSVWGATLGASTVVPRSGIGVTADGALVYVAGPALSARTLAESLQRAGAVRAMTLDINPEWVTFNFFGHPHPANPYAVSSAALYPQQQRPSTRYLGPTLEARDFVEVRTPAPIVAGRATGPSSSR